MNLVSIQAYPGIIIGLGIILRIERYLFNRPLFIDEAWLALNVFNRSLAELLQPLDYHQAAPVGFLFVQKLLVATLGTSELALRLIPLLCGIVSLVLFHRLAVRYLSAGALLVALGLFALSRYLLYYAVEFKQYSSDVMIALGLFLLAIHVYENGLTPAMTGVLAVAGVIASWVSHPAIFVLAGTGSALALHNLRGKDWNRLNRLILILLLWGASFLVQYMINLRYTSDNAYLIHFWRSHLMPLSPDVLPWFVERMYWNFANPGSIVPVVAAPVFILGCLLLGRRRSALLLFLFSPVPFLLLASALGKYPFGDRFLLFLVPALLIPISEGALQVIRSTNRYKLVAALLVVGLLFSWNVLMVFSPSARFRDDMRSAVEYISAARQPGDIVYMDAFAEPGFIYYAERTGLVVDRITAADDTAPVPNSLPLPGTEQDRLHSSKRVWLICTARSSCADTGIPSLTEYLDGLGFQLRSWHLPEVTLYLYALRHTVGR